MHPFSEERADEVAACAAGYAYNLLPALTHKNPSEVWAELQEMFCNAIRAYCASSGFQTWPPEPSEN
jgi:hypothetical protein